MCYMWTKENLLFHDRPIELQKPLDCIVILTQAENTKSYQPTIFFYRSKLKADEKIQYGAEHMTFIGRSIKKLRK